MTRRDFYNDRKKELKIDFLADYRLVRKYFCTKYEIPQGDIELLWKLRSLGKFIKNDFEVHKGIHHWDPNRFTRLEDEGWIYEWREKWAKKDQNYSIYMCTQKGNQVVADMYKTLCGELPIPESIQGNPLMKRRTYTEKVYSAAIKRFNEEMKLKRAED